MAMPVGGERVVPAGVEGESFGHELHAHPASGELGDELGEVDHRAGQAVHRRHSHGVAASDVAQHRRQRGPLGAAAAADPVGERFLDVPDRGDLAGGVLVGAADPDVADRLPLNLYRHV